jgi:hypothetical protein
MCISDTFMQQDDEIQDFNFLLDLLFSPEDGGNMFL